MSEQALAQMILDLIKEAKTDAEPKDAEEEYEGRIPSVLFDALEAIEKLCQEHLPKEVR